MKIILMIICASDNNTQQENGVRSTDPTQINGSNSDPNSVMQSVQTQPLLEQSQSVPPVTQTFANQEITPKPKVA